MKSIRDAIRQLRQNVAPLITTLLASMLSTMITTAFLLWVKAGMINGNGGDQLLVTLSAAIIFGIVLTGAFYLLAPNAFGKSGG